MGRYILLTIVMAMNAACVAAQQASTASENAVYSVKFRKAKDLADLLGRQFKTDGTFRALDDSATNQVVLSGLKDQVTESLRLLAQLDRKPATIAVEAFFFVAAEQKSPATKDAERSWSLKDFAGPTETITAKIQALAEQKQIAELQRLQLNVQENQKGDVKQSEMRPVVTGRTVTATGIMTQSITRMNVGVNRELTPRRTPNREIVLDLTLGWSRLHTQMDGIQFPSNSSFTGPVAVLSGHAALVRAAKTTAPMEGGQTFVVITAKILP
jgi:type II secretory pathway component GspD/PulD (secretin)